MPGTSAIIKYSSAVVNMILHPATPIPPAIIKKKKASRQACRGYNFARAAKKQSIVGSHSPSPHDASTTPVRNTLGGSLIGQQVQNWGVGSMSRTQQVRRSHLNCHRSFSLKNQYWVPNPTATKMNPRKLTVSSMMSRQAMGAADHTHTARAASWLTLFVTLWP